MATWLNLAALEEQLKTRWLGRRLLYYTSLGSTQDVARQEAEQGAPQGTVVLAEEQTAGRGRLGRPWVSPAGSNLYLTLILRPSMRQLRSLGIIAPLAIALALEEVTDLSPRIKWPNDVLVSQRKVAGVLIDSGLAGEEARYALVGLGINVNLDVQAHPDIAATATSLRAEVGHSVAREAVLAACLNRFEALYRGPAQAAFQQWRARLETLGRAVRVTFAGGTGAEEGIAEDVATDGSLILRRANGSRLRVVAGEVTLR